MRVHDLLPPPRMLMTPGPAEADPRVLRAMAAPLLGQFDPYFTGLMNETMELLRLVFQTQNHWAFVVDGTSRAGLEAVLVSLIEPGDRVLVPIIGRFGHLLTEIAERCGADVATLPCPWGTVVEPDALKAALQQHRPKLVAMVHGETSTGMMQPLEWAGALCREHGALLVVDAVATLGGVPVKVDEWGLDACIAGTQKCLGAPSGSAPVTFNDRAAALIERRRHVEQGLRGPQHRPGPGPRIRSNYFDLAMLMDYWSPVRINHHTEAGSMLYAVREALRCVAEEGLEARFARHRLHGEAVVAGVTAMGLELFGDRQHKMPQVTPVLIPEGVNGDQVRAMLLEDFGIEIATSFGPLHGKVWRIGTMGYSAQKRNVLLLLGALATCLRAQGFRADGAAAVDAALAVYRAAGA